MKIANATLRLLTLTHRGGKYGYWWNAESKLSIWWPVGNPLDIPSEKGNWYYGVHPTGHRRSKHERARIRDIAVINCVFADFDAADLSDKERVWEHLGALSVPPSIIIDSGGGYHGYWLLRDPFVIATESDRNHVRQLQASWVALVKGDLGAKDLARVLRVPGTRNFKAKYAAHYPLVDFVRREWDQVYSLEDFERLSVRVDPTPRGIPIGQSGHWHSCNASTLQREIDKLLATPAGKRNSQLNQSAYVLGHIIAIGALDRSTVEARLLDSAQTVGLGKREAIATIRSGLEAGMRAIR